MVANAEKPVKRKTFNSCVNIFYNIEDIITTSCKEIIKSEILTDRIEGK